MASVIARPRGAHWVQFTWDRKRRTVRLGKVRRAVAEKYAELLELLLEHARAGVDPPVEVKLWLQRMPDGPHRTLATAGLVTPRPSGDQSGDRPCDHSLGELVDAFLGRLESEVRRGETKPATLRNARRTAENLREFWGAERPLAEITPAEAERFRGWLAEKGHHKAGGLAPTTVSRRCRRVREIFQLAVDDRWLAENPLRRMRRWKETNRERDVYVPADWVRGAMRETMDLEDRLLLALARWGGLRVPSEVRPLRLVDFDVAREVVLVRSPKTEHHEGHESRWVPLWPEIRAAFDALFDASPDGATHALPRLRQISSAAITKRASSLVVRSGVEPWPKFWVNLRASCERDLLETYPIDKVAKWMGHSPKTALLHYGRVDQHRDASSATASPPPAEAAGGEAESEAPMLSDAGQLRTAEG